LSVRVEQDLVDLVRALKEATPSFLQLQQKAGAEVDHKAQVQHLVVQVVVAVPVMLMDVRVPLQRLVKATLAAMGQEERTPTMLVAVVVVLAVLVLMLLIIMAEMVELVWLHP
jgi:hypothetical protein